MKVTWIDTVPLHDIPDQYWGEDLSQFDSKRSGKVIDTHRSWWGKLYLVVSCDDGAIRQVEASIVKVEQ